MPWLTLTVDTDAQHAEALSEALLELGALSVDLLDADAGTPDEQAIFGEPGEAPPGVWQHNRVSALFDDDQDVPAILREAASSIGLEQLPEHNLVIYPDGTGHPGPLITPETGLIGSPERLPIDPEKLTDQLGFGGPGRPGSWRITALLDPTIGPGTIVTVKSQ